MVELLNNERFGTAHFFHYSDVFFTERFKYIHYERFLLLGEFIIGGPTAYYQNATISILIIYGNVKVCIEMVA